MIASDQSFNLITHREFWAPLEYINSVVNQMLSDSGQTIKIHAKALFYEEKQWLQHVLATFISDIHITCDMWTSPNHLGILAVIGHFTTEKLKLSTCLLGLVEIQGPHSELNQSQAVLIILVDFDILDLDKLDYFVMNSVSSNNALIQGIADALKNQGISYDVNQWHLYCNDHIINLAVQTFLFKKKINDYQYSENITVSSSDAQLNQWWWLRPLEKLYNIIV